MRYLTSLLGLCLFATVVRFGNAAVQHHIRHKAKTFADSVKFKFRLRVCNAYPYAAALDVFRSREKITKQPLEYTMCGDLSNQLIVGDKLKFMVGDANAGTFTISDLPNNDAILLVVIHRHDTLSNAVAFKSHVFANLLNAQVAVIDTYKGMEKSLVEIADGGKEEGLRYNSVVALNPGEYNVRLVSAQKSSRRRRRKGDGGRRRRKGDKSTTVEMSKTMVALNRESYVVIRTGVEAQQGPQYPQDLIVYPMSDRSLLQQWSASHRTTFPVGIVATALALVSFFC